MTEPDPDELTLEEFCREWKDSREHELDEIWRDIENPDKGELGVRERFEGEVVAYERVLAFLNDEVENDA